MKKLSLLWVMGVLLITPLLPLSATEVNSQQVIIQVDGLSCPFCAYGLEKHLKKIQGVQSVQIDMQSGKATVAFKSKTKIDDATLTEAVRKAGFTARKILHP